MVSLHALAVVALQATVIQDASIRNLNATTIALVTRTTRNVTEQTIVMTNPMKILIIAVWFYNSNSPFPFRVCLYRCFYKLINVHFISRQGISNLRKCFLCDAFCRRQVHTLLQSSLPRRFCNRLRLVRGSSKCLENLHRKIQRRDEWRSASCIQLSRSRGWRDKGRCKFMLTVH